MTEQLQKLRRLPDWYVGPSFSLFPLLSAFLMLPCDG
jgi:hypothetical protein